RIKNTLFNKSLLATSDTSHVIIQSSFDSQFIYGKTTRRSIVIITTLNETPILKITNTQQIEKNIIRHRSVIQSK
ncbi:hypothetical protein, partial [Serratia liquefaciens]|uniref:hypothetical protein n=1 Tax=Serratia liquefaciens TaxID=614 RepID=UPI0021AED1C9